MRKHSSPRTTHSTRIAIAGFGFMGRMHYGNWKRIRHAQVVAICDANLARLTTVTDGNIAGSDTSTDFTGIAIYDDYEQMLAAGGFDVVDITLPTPLHPSTTIAALSAGFHVLCEKPMALTVADCDRMLATAQKTGKLLLVAHCLRFWPEYVALRRLITSRKYGAVIAADFTRAGSAPDPNGLHAWFLDASRSGGCLLDLHLHDADMILSLFGKPPHLSIWSHTRADGVLDHAQIRYLYPDKIVTATVSWAAPPTLGFEAGFRITLERATIICDSKRTTPFMVYPTKGRPFAPKAPRMSAYEAEQRYFLDRLNGRGDATFLTAQDARDVVQLITTSPNFQGSLESHTSFIIQT